MDDKLKTAILAFEDFLNEPPQYEDQRMVRDYRHEAYRKWSELRDQINATVLPTWEHISTAPKDGTQILGCWKTDVMDVIWWSPGGRSGREWCNDDGFLSTPPYWQPLPAGPLIAEERTK